MQPSAIHELQNLIHLIQSMTLLSPQRNIMFLLYFMSSLLMVSSLQSHQYKYYGRRRQQSATSIILFNVVDDSNSNNNNIPPPVDTMRTMLESSWNTIKMGRIPVDAEAAAKEAYLSIIRAATGATTVDDCEDNIKEEDDTNIVGTFFVDLLLPSYDIKQVQKGQTNLYDEVAAVEYCISLANCFKGKTEIIVRDDKTLQTVTKVLDARERNKNIMMKEDNNVDVKIDEEDHDGNDVKDDDENDKSVGDDLFVGEETTTTTNNMDSYRQKLISNWDEQDPITTSEDGPKSKSEDSTIETSSASSSSSSNKSYRLASLFGNVRIDQGPDMATRIIQALRNNALAKDDEDNIIILSAIGKDEMVAVRALVTKYGNEKKIILVNCQFQPTPRELLSAETVYSVLPLMARKNMKNDNNNNNNNNNTIPPKVVCLRRYPKNWEIFVDVGNGYELAETVPINGSNKRGLSMEFIARGVARHLDFVSRR
jgi:hypothetical protein